MLIITKADMGYQRRFPNFCVMELKLKEMRVKWWLRGIKLNRAIV